MDYIEVSCIEGQWELVFNIKSHLKQKEELGRNHLNLSYSRCSLQAILASQTVFALF